MIWAESGKDVGGCHDSILHYEVPVADKNVVMNSKNSCFSSCAEVGVFYIIHRTFIPVSNEPVIPATEYLIDKKDHGKSYLIRRYHDPFFISRIKFLFRAQRVRQSYHLAALPGAAWHPCSSFTPHIPAPSSPVAPVCGA